MPGRTKKQKWRKEKLQRLRNSQNRPPPYKPKLSIFPENPSLPHLREIVLAPSFHAQLYDAAEVQESELKESIPIPSLPKHKITSDLEKIPLGRHPKELQDFYERLNSGKYFLKPTPEGRAYLGYQINFYEKLITVENRLPITSHSSAYSFLENLFNPIEPVIIVYQIFEDKYDVNVIASKNFDLKEFDEDISMCSASFVLQRFPTPIYKEDTDSSLPDQIDIYAGIIRARDIGTLEYMLKETPVTHRKYDVKIVVGKSYGKPPLFDLARQALWTPKIEDLVKRTF